MELTSTTRTAAHRTQELPMPQTTDIPDLTGKLAVVTGASDGIGQVIASRLARRAPR